MAADGREEEPVTAAHLVHRADPVDHPGLVKAAREDVILQSDYRDGPVRPQRFGGEERMVPRPAEVGSEDVTAAEEEESGGQSHEAGRPGGKKNGKV